MPKQKTIIEGVVYYDGKKIIQRVAIAKERNELIGQLLQEKTKVLIHKNQKRKEKKEYH
jgi:hypothetical protein